MRIREQIINLVNKMPEDKLGFVLQILIRITSDSD